MKLKNKNAVIYGAGGAIGSSVARAFARDGAKVFLTGQNPKSLESIHKEITGAGGDAEIAKVDALNEKEINDHMDSLIAKHGHIDVTFNAISLHQKGIQGIPLLEIPIESFSRPIEMYAKSHLLTARAAARNMIKKGSGVIITLTASPSKAAAALVGGMAPAWSSVESLARTLSAELGQHGVRVVNLRPDGLPETETIKTVAGLHAQVYGLPSHNEFLGMMASMTQLKKLPTLQQVADTAAFIASDGAGAITGTTVNLSCGSIVD